jgi:RimJ/RimL family protein N-acetyltransferase
MEDLIHEALRHTGRFPLLGLFIHPENRPAMRVYERWGFERYSVTYTNADNITYQSMLLRLNG